MYNDIKESPVNYNFIWNDYQSNIIINNMKYIQILSIILASIIIQGHSQIINNLLSQDMSLIRPNLDSKLIILPTADCYEGLVDVAV